MHIKNYASDLTDKQWQLIAPHMPPEKEKGRSRTTKLREVVNALLYMSVLFQKRDTLLIDLDCYSLNTSSVGY